VFVPLPPFLIADLKNCPDQIEHFWFWSGEGEKKTCARNWRRAFDKLFKIASLRDEEGMRKRCHPHMFRDTFAVELLLSGAPIEEVAMLLGHENLETTIKSYAPWVRERQQKLIRSVKKMWGDVVSIDAGRKENIG
jgi:integrase